MTGMVVAGLLATACVFLVLPTVHSRGMPRAHQGVGAPGAGHDEQHAGIGAGDPRSARRPAARDRSLDLHELPLLIHQLAGLLQAGRPPQVLWADLEFVHAQGRTTFSRAVLPVLATARRAAGLGLSVPDALRDAASRCVDPRVAGADRVERLWIDLAGCLEVAERSGAPLAGILEHYAAELDAELDGVSARETALAGPRATVVLLAWLPAAGLVLGFALGINPLEILLTSPSGRFAMITGALLMLISRVWSRQLVQRARTGARG